jgi:hypothetical protein
MRTYAAKQYSAGTTGRRGTTTVVQINKSIFTRIGPKIIGNSFQSEIWRQIIEEVKEWKWMQNIMGKITRGTSQWLDNLGLL